ncbi:MAG: hypothetical protein AB1429_07225 [Pseudomonadota bacterium]
MTETWPTVIGLAALTHRAYAGEDLGALFEGLKAQHLARPDDAGVLMDLATLLILTGQSEAGLELQAEALKRSRVYIRPGTPGGLRVLAIVAPGDFMANTPIDFLLHGSDASLILAFTGDGAPLPADLPAHDVAFLAVGESDRAQPWLAALQAPLTRWPSPLANANPMAIAGLTRTSVAALFADSQVVLAPATARVERRTVEALAAGAPLSDVLAGAQFPIIIRPVHSHAGQGLSKIDAADDLASYLASQDDALFYLAPFIDYRNPDGRFRKLRVAVIDGAPFASHLAISDHWMVHYLNAGMEDSAWKRDEEAQVMAGFDHGFAARHGAAFAQMHQRFGLDYFAIDCGETADGRLLLFEADVAMIVHAMDDPDMFPYKQPQMLKVFKAFRAMLDQVRLRG